MSRAHPEYEPRHCGCRPCVIREAVRRLAEARIYFDTEMGKLSGGAR